MADSRSRRVCLRSTTLPALLLIASANASWAAPPRTLAAAPEVEVGAVAGSAAVARFEGVARTDDGRIQVMVELQVPPAAVAYAAAMEGLAVNDAAAKAVAGSISRSQVDRIRAEQASMVPQLTGSVIGGRELFRVQKALNGIALAVDPSASRRCSPPPVSSACCRSIPRYLPTPPACRSSARPNVWGNTTVPPLPAGADGTGIRIGIIDTGIDYLHADFGGTGLLADYQGEATDTSGYTTVGTAASAASPPPRWWGAPTSRGTPTPAPTPLSPTPTRWTASAMAATSPAPPPVSGVDAGGNPYAGP